MAEIALSHSTDPTRLGNDASPWGFGAESSGRSFAMGDGRSYGDGGWGMEPIRRSGLGSPLNSQGKKEAGAA